MKCLFCHMPINVVVNEPLTREIITTKGNMYSEAGVREVEMSQMCEVCFDEVTLPNKEAVQEYRNYLIGA